VTRRATAATLVLVGALSGCGGDGDGDRPSGEEAFEAVATQLATGAEEESRRAAPRWESVETLRGSGVSSESVEIADDAIQWRVRWQCSDGEFELSTGGTDLARGRCPGRGRETSVETGNLELEVRSSGGWAATVEQQVDTPLQEPPLQEIGSGAAQRLASGTFYRIERRGSGSAALYRLPNGRLALRLERFETSANSDLFVWLSDASRPRTTKQFRAAPHAEIAALKSTLGDQNYILPRVDLGATRSVVIWCEPIRTAYTAATLGVTGS
jgi:Electron transfer DM13